MTKSQCFSDSNYFTETNEFTTTNDFSMSFQFTESEKFSKSSDFSDFSPKNPIYIEIKEDESHGITAGMKAGIGAAAGVAALAAIVVGIIFLRRKKMVSIDNIDENIEIIEDTNSTLVNQNPLINLMSDDDPFEDEFE